MRNTEVHSYCKNSMNRQDIINKFLGSDIFKKWHFFKYHFDFYNRGDKHPLAESITNAITDIENLISGAGLDYIKKIASINDKKDNTQHYVQLLQVLAELLIVHHVAKYPWINLCKLEYEPTARSSKQNPELIVETKAFKLGIEVKSPELVKKHNERAEKQFQLPSRSDLHKLIDPKNTMLPRDNPVKDFLISSNNKFSSFKKQNPKFFNVLVIVWDDFIYEPISALLSPQSGLMTENSFALDETNKVLRYPNLDLIILTRHLLPIKCGTRDEIQPYVSKHPLDYGRDCEFPFKVYIKNPNSKLKIPE